MLNRIKQSQQQWRNPKTLPNPQFNKQIHNNINDAYPAPLNFHTEKQNQLGNRNILLPNFNNNFKSKPLISPKNSQLSERMSQNNFNGRGSHKFQNTTRYTTNTCMTDRSQNGANCVNHPTKKAQFLVEGQDQYYCGRCAAQLATQGCQIHRLDQSRSQCLSQSKRNDIPNLPQYENQPIYKQIKQILKLCNNVISEHNSNLNKFSSLQQNYDQQLQKTQNFYNTLVQIIEQMKTDHMNDLMSEKHKYTQIADIQNDYLQENITEINVIKHDIENHLEEVLEGIKETGDSAECRESLEHYRQKLTLFRHQTEEQLDSLKGVTYYSEEKLQNMITSFQNFLTPMWDDVSGPAEERDEDITKQVTKNLNSAMTVKNIHQILPKGVNYDNCEGKSAFRNLQDDEEQNLNERKSPNFKRI